MSDSTRNNIGDFAHSDSLIGLASPIVGNSADSQRLVCSPTSADSLCESNPYLFPGDLLSDAGSIERHSSELSGSLSGVNSAESDQCLPDPAAGEQTNSWWLLHTKPRQEKKLAEQLKAFQLPHYLPVTKKKAVTRGKVRYSWSPLFSGYLFLMGTPEQRVRALETNRVVSTHESKDKEELARRLRELSELIRLGVPLTAEARLAPGREVRLKSGIGSLQGMEGIVEKRAGQTRLFVFVSELLGGVSLEIEEHLLEPIY